jgi:hypothetical protein
MTSVQYTVPIFKIIDTHTNGGDRSDRTTQYLQYPYRKFPYTAKFWDFGILIKKLNYFQIFKFITDRESGIIGMLRRTEIPQDQIPEEFHDHLSLASPSTPCTHLFSFSDNLFQILEQHVTTRTSSVACVTSEYSEKDFSRNMHLLVVRSRYHNLTLRTQVS